MAAADHSLEARLAARPPTLYEKVTFLQRAGSYGPLVTEVTSHETHMSLVFLAGDRAYKLKKPVRFPYLDFSTVERRETACRAELKLNRRLAPNIYLDVVPLTYSERGLTIGGEGKVVDWLVVMSRLDQAQMLDRAIANGWLRRWQLDRVVGTLVRFYRHASAELIAPTAYVAGFQRSLAYDLRILLDPRFRLPAGMVRHIACIQRQFLTKRTDLLAERVRRRHIVEGHGDLRPEHIFLGDPIRIIDCLEFNARLRMVDPLDEIAFLCVECERLGAPWAARYLQRRFTHLLDGSYPDEVFTFYRCHRATLRARLAIAHLLESAPRSPEKWPVLARSYLRLAAMDAIKLERALKRPGDHRAYHRHADGGQLRPGAAPPAGYRAWHARRPNRAGMPERHR
jgi:uncharacterized protein